MDQFGVCLIDETSSVKGWNAPKTSWNNCKNYKMFEDVELDGSTITH